LWGIIPDFLANRAGRAGVGFGKIYKKLSNPLTTPNVKRVLIVGGEKAVRYRVLEIVKTVFDNLQKLERNTFVSTISSSGRRLDSARLIALLITLPKSRIMPGML